jgi:hypothetical protein
MPPIEYDRQVFLNCPFDDDYKTLLRALAFTVLDCGLVPRLASHRADSGEVRVTSRETTSGRTAAIPRP